MSIKRLARKLPPIAWRDELLRSYRDQNKRLLKEVSRSRGRAYAERIAGWDRRTMPASLEDQVGAIRRSRLFDEEWYSEQLPTAPDPGTDLVAHYLTEGFRHGLSPHPAFDSTWYLRQRGVPRGPDIPPLLHYLTWGAPACTSPHPMFDASAYAQVHPETVSVPGGPLAHFLYGGVTGGGTQDPHDGAPVNPAAPHEFLEAARHAARVIRESRGYEHLRRDHPTFDFEAEAAFKAELRSEPLPQPSPVVTVILPTKDRAEALPAAVDSVVNQTYPDWHLVIVDDGSEDDTPEILTPYLADERITYLSHGQNRGVAAARNTGLSVATGEYIAYLDSDNSWHEDYLELMIRFMRRGGHRVAYAMSALSERGGQERRLYRGMPFSREALEERNYIDCIVLVHERALFDAVGKFDETLKRNVDWDLFIRLARECDFGFAPILATEYDVWEVRGGRITTEELETYRYRVRQRALVDWDGLKDSVSERDPDLVTVILVASSTADAILATVNRLLETSQRPVEVVLVDNKIAEAESTRLQFGVLALECVTLHRLSQALPLEAARNVAVVHSHGANLVFMPESAWCEAGWDEPLLRALEEYAVAQPLVLYSGGAVWSAGTSFLRGGRTVQSYRGFAGDAPEVRGTRPVGAASALCLAVEAATFISVQGFDPLYIRHYTGSDLSLRLTAETGQQAACAGASKVALSQDPPPPRRSSGLNAARDNDRHLASVWGDRVPLDRRLGHDGYAVVGFQRRSHEQLDPTPLLVHDRPGRPLRWAIKIGAATVEQRTNWGDWHFARALQDSLEKLGHEVTIDCHNAWYRPTAHLDDVVLVLRGVSPYVVNPGHTNVCWVISHPDRVVARELSDYDLVYSASKRWSGRVSARLPRPAGVLLQCTDARRFVPTAPDRGRQHEVLAVANARREGVPRPAVSAALESGIVPSVYGVRWDGLLPAGSWQGRYLANEELPGVYAAAGVVLNDHWDDMREEGFLSNRLFDLAACEARVISDHLPEVSEVFGDVVLTYRSAQEMPGLVAAHLEETPERRQARQRLGRHVREEHTFDARAAQLSREVLELRGHVTRLRATS